METYNFKTEEATFSKPPIDQYLNTFKSIIDILSSSDNVAIGGYQALKLHGLILNREPGDLDLIIFDPTPKQFAALKVLSCFDIIKNRPKDVTTEEIKAFKFKKADLFMDVIICKDSTPCLLSFTCSVGTFKVNSVENIIKAKRSYKFRYNEDTCEYGSETNTYARTKDMLDFQQLKNINFNM